MTDPCPAIDAVAARWPDLTDVDRAEAMRPIIESGVSQRELAASLPCSAATVRRLLVLLEAAPKDLEAARQRQISTNELERRAKRAKASNNRRSAEAMERQRLNKVATGTLQVVRWLAADDSSSGNAEQIVQEARLKLQLAEQTGGLPVGPTPIASSLGEIIRRTRPPGPAADQIDVDWFAEWLAI